MTPTPRPLRWILTTLLALTVTLVPVGASAAQDGTRSSGQDNEAVAVNTEDGSSVFRFALSVRRVADGVVDQTNTARAEASCVDCRTVAVAFQVLLVTGDADVVVPENLAVAANSQCAECFTYATATQIVIGVPEGSHLTPEGQRRLKDLEKRMKELEKNPDQLSDAEMLVAVQEAEAELVAIFEEELVTPDPPTDQGTDGTTTTTSTTTVVEGTTTSTTLTPSTTEATEDTIDNPAEAP